MNSEDKIAEGNGKEAVWVVGVLCGIVLIVLLAFSVQRKTELTKAEQKIEELADQNRELAAENENLNAEISALQKRLDSEKKENATLKEKADAYDSAQRQIRDFAKKLESLFPEEDDSL